MNWDPLVMWKDSQLVTRNEIFEENEMCWKYICEQAWTPPEWVFEIRFELGGESHAGHSHYICTPPPPNTELGWYFF